MSDFRNLLIFTVLCNAGLGSSTDSGQNYFYFHRTNHPSIYQSNNYQNVIPFNPYSVPTPTPAPAFFSSPYIPATNYNARSSYAPQDFHSRSNVNIIANSATYPHAYVPIQEYPAPAHRNLINNQFPTQRFYPVYNTPAAPVPNYAPPNNFQFLQKPLKPLQPLRPLTPFPQFIRLSSPAPRINFGNTVYPQSTLNALAQPNFYQIKQLYGIKNTEQPRVTGYSYSIGNNDRVTSTITVNFGSAKPFDPIPQQEIPAIQAIPAEQGEVANQPTTTTVLPSEATSEKEPSKKQDAGSEGSSQTVLETTNPVQDKSDGADDSQLKDIDESVTKDTDASVNKDPVTVENEGGSVSSLNDTAVASDSGLQDNTQVSIPNQGIDVLLQPPPADPPTVETGVLDSEDKHSETVGSSASNNQKDLDAPITEEGADAPKSESNGATSDLETELASEPQVPTSSSTSPPVLEQAPAVPSEYDYFTDPDNAEKEVIELRSLGRKNLPKAQALEPSSETSAKFIPETSAKSIPETSATSIPETSVKSIPETSVKSIPETSVKSIPETSAISIRVDISTEGPSNSSEPGLVNTDILNEDKETTSSAKLEPTTDQPHTDIPVEPSNEKRSETASESPLQIKVETSTSMTSTTEIVDPRVMRTISNRTIEISNRKVRVVIKRRVSRPARRTSFPLALPRRF